MIELRDLTDPVQQAAYVQDAIDAQDPFLIVLALKEIGTVRRVPVVLDENPMLSEVLRALRDLGLELQSRPTPQRSASTAPDVPRVDPRPGDRC